MFFRVVLYFNMHLNLFLRLFFDAIFKHFLKNKLMLGVVFLTFVLQILIIQFAGAFFGTVPLDGMMWLKIMVVSASVIFLSEVVKLIYRLAVVDKVQMN